MVYSVLTVYLALTFLFSAIAKLRHMGSFVEVTQAYEVLSSPWDRIFACLLPFLEMGAVVFLLFRQTHVGEYGSLVGLLSVFAWAVGSVIHSGRVITCGCYGKWMDAQADRFTLLEDRVSRGGLHGTARGTNLRCGHRSSGPSAHQWCDSFSFVPVGAKNMDFLPKQSGQTSTPAERRKTVNEVLLYSNILLWLAVLLIGFTLFIIFRQFGEVYLSTGESIARDGIAIGERAPSLSSQNLERATGPLPGSQAGAPGLSQPGLQGLYRFNSGLESGGSSTPSNPFSCHPRRGPTLIGENFAGTGFGRRGAL